MKEEIAALLNVPNGLTVEMVNAVLAVGRENAIPALRALILESDDKLTVRAASVLALIDGGDVVSVLIELMEIGVQKKDPLLMELCIGSLARRGQTIVEPCLEAVKKTEVPMLRCAIADALSQSGSKDERIFELLVALLPEFAMTAAGGLADFGDARALPALRTFLDSVHKGVRPPYAHEIFYVTSAIETLGGALNRKDVQLLKRAERGSLSQPRRRGREAPARNDLCWCGSGVKFKKCCMRSAQAEAAA
ncbi:MAG: SEC-C metal-binding domain-containing protein [Myxococcaceae bacterium]